MRHGNDSGQRGHLQRTIVSLPMSLMDFRIIQHRRWGFLARRNLREHLRVSHEKGVERFDHLTSHATNHTSFSRPGLCPFIVWALGLDQPFVQSSPLIVPQSNSLENCQDHDLLHGSGATAGQAGAIQRTSRLRHNRCPSTIRLESRGAMKIVDRADSRDNRRRCHWSHTRKRLENLSFPRMFDDAHHLGFQLLNVLEQEPKFFDQLALFQHHATLSNEVFHAKA